MEVIAKLQQCTPVQSGTSKNGNPWKKTEIIAIIQDGDRTSIAAFTAFGNVCDNAMKLRPGATVRIRYRIDSEEFTDRNGNRRWSTQATAYSVVELQAQYAQQGQMTQNQAAYIPEPQAPAQEQQPQQQMQQPASNADELPPQNLGFQY